MSEKTISYMGKKCIRESFIFQDAWHLREAILVKIIVFVTPVIPIKWIKKKLASLFSYSLIKKNI